LPATNYFENFVVNYLDDFDDNYSWGIGVVLDKVLDVVSGGAR
jgi:hypothetical protein